MIPVKVVFQGGGAKLVTLMAAAEAIQQLEAEGRIKVSRVAGTSAGSIVACMQASSRPYAEYRQAVIDAGRLVIRYLKAPGPKSAMWKAYWGKPLLPESKLREFLRSIFGNATLRLNDLLCPTTVVASDLSQREKVIYRSDDSNDGRLLIEDVIADSCALPFIFRTYRNKKQIVDGGICSNLPAETLFTDDPEEAPDTLMLAFSFDPETQTSPTGVGDYALALMSTAIDASVATAAARIEAAGGVVCRLPLEYGTIEFEKALEEGLSPSRYAATVKLVRYRIEEALEIHWEKSHVKESSGSLRSKMLETHRSLLNAFPYDAVRASTYVIANSLRDKNDPRSDQPDEVFQKVEFTARNRVLWSIRVGISTAYLAPVAGDADWRIEAPDGQDVKATHVIVPEPSTDGNSTKYYALFYFLKPVTLEHDQRLRVVLRSTQRDVFSGLKTQAPEFMRTRIATNREVEEHVIAIPTDYSTIELSDLADGVHRLPEGSRPADIEKMRSHWKAGRRMTPEELSEHASLPPDGCKLYGWRTENAKRHDYCGVLLTPVERAQP